MTLDKYGIIKKNKTKSGGTEWFNTWDNGHSRTLTDGGIDPYDSSFKYTNGSPDNPVTIDGTGKCQMSAATPTTSARMWVNKTWLNTEMTCYVKKTGAMVDFQMRSRSKHTQSATSNCLWGNYDISWRHDVGLVTAEVEVTHPVYARSLNQHTPAVTPILTGNYVGFKQVTRTFGNKVVVKGYSNHTASGTPGDVGDQSKWIKDIEYVFDGTNATAVSDDPNIFSFCGTTGDNLLGDLTANTLWLNPGNSCWLRMNQSAGFILRYYSVREINPIL